MQYFQLNSTNNDPGVSSVIDIYEVRLLPSFRPADSQFSASQNIHAKLSNDSDSTVLLSCADPAGKCTASVRAYNIATKLYFCPSFYDQPIPVCRRRDTTVPARGMTMLRHLAIALANLTEVETNGGE
jgi:hypothetical protein